MEDVACVVTSLILYRHFETKEELCRAVLQEVFDRMGQELQSGLAAGSTRGLGARTVLTVVREEPAAFTLLWRHGAREPQFAECASELRSISVEVVSRFIPVQRRRDRRPLDGRVPVRLGRRGDARLARTRRPVARCRVRGTCDVRPARPPSGLVQIATVASARPA
jgi:AcrR family transcriptional regulator